MTDFRLKVRMFFRSFLVQASWNFEKLQNLGFAFIILPALEARYGDSRERFRSALEQHLGYFNTHPYFGGLVAGAIAGEEGGTLDEGRFIEDLKRALMSTLGSVGDGFFWAGLRPLAALAAFLPALFGLWWAPLLFLLLFNVPHLSLRWWGLSAGLNYGCQVIRRLETLRLSRFLPWFSLGIVALAGAGAGAASVHRHWSPVPGRAVPSLLVGGGLFLAGLLLSETGKTSRKGVRP